VNQLFAAAAEVQQYCQQRNWKFCFIGGLATLRWGEPRFTGDVDLTILANYGEEELVIDGLLDRFVPRLRDARHFALAHRVVLVSATNGTPVDVALGALDFEERTMERASLWDANGVMLLTCSADDLIVHKVFAGRDRDWADIGGIVARQRGKLDRTVILAELAPLLQAKGDSENLTRAGDMLAADA